MMDAGFHTPEEVGTAFAVAVVEAKREARAEALPSYLLRVSNQLDAVVRAEVEPGKRFTLIEYEDLRSTISRFMGRNVLCEGWSVDREAVVERIVELLAASQE